jgi:hypothetical protein
MNRSLELLGKSEFESLAVSQDVNYEQEDAI